MTDVLHPPTLLSPTQTSVLHEKDATHIIQVQELSSSSSASSTTYSSSTESDSDSEPESLSLDDKTTTLKSNPNLDLSKTHLISSPYPDPGNQLDLTDLALPDRLFAHALTSLRPVREDYATAPYLEAFNWDEVFARLRELSSAPHAGFEWSAGDDGREHEFYVVIFRSKLAAGIDRERLGELDQRSHEEACASGGLLKYWFGSPDGERRNLATCLWRNHADAVAGGKGPWHALARAAARTMYDRIDFHVHRLVIERDAKSWRLEKFVR